MRLKTDLVILWDDPDTGRLMVTEPAPALLAKGLSYGLSLPEIIDAVADMDLPDAVLNAKSNRPAYIVCRRSQLPDSRAYRNAWRRADALPD